MVRFSYNPIVFELALLATGIAFILSSLFVRFRDIGPIWEVFLQAGLYATPIIYSLTFILQRGQVTFAKLMMLNPVAQIIQDLRHFIVYSGNTTVSELIENPVIVAIPYILPVVVYLLGITVFRKMPKSLRRFCNGKNNNIAVKVEHVSKSFKLPTESSQSLRTTLVNLFKGIKGYVEYNVLQDISFEVEKGLFGIVGRNGSGKSTLLKILSQIYVPERGTVAVDGKLVSFIELGVGFNPELTGKENVYLNGAMLGFTAEEIDAMYDDIVEFAELSEFMNQKLKNYSSGMQVRLAFSVAIKAQGDILILDEVLAVGDEAFQRKCNDYFLERKKWKNNHSCHP